MPAGQSSLGPLSIHESSESLSITSMSCDYDTAPSEDEGRLGSRAERKRILLERLMHYFHSIFATCPQQTRTHGGNGEPSQRQTGDQSLRDQGELQLNVGGRAAGRNQDNRKRRPEDEDGDDEGDGSDRKRPRRHTDTEEPPMRLACPYFKNNPRRYRLSRSCPGPGWSTVHRVKYAPCHLAPYRKLANTKQGAPIPMSPTSHPLPLLPRDVRLGQASAGPSEG